MKRGYIAGCAIGLFSVLMGCSGTPTPAADTSAADQKAIKDGEIAWNGDFASKDIDKILGHYADDASLLVPGMPIMKGKDAIRTGLTAMLADPNLALTLTTSDVQVSKSGDLAYSQGSCSTTMTNPKTKKPETEEGKYVMVYKKQADGSWKAVEDIDNADAPPVSAATAKTKRTPAATRKKRK